MYHLDDLFVKMCLVASMLEFIISCSNGSEGQEMVSRTAQIESVNGSVITGENKLSSCRVPAILGRSKGNTPLIQFQCSTHMRPHIHLQAHRDDHIDLSRLGLLPPFSAQPFTVNSSASLESSPLLSFIDPLSVQALCSAVSMHLVLL